MEYMEHQENPYRFGGSKQKVMTMNDFVGTMTKAALGAYDLKADDAKNFLSPYKMMLPEIKKNILDIIPARTPHSRAIPGRWIRRREFYKTAVPRHGPYAPFPHICPRSRPYP